MNVFVSYTVSDEEAADDVTRTLRAAGFNAWRDVDGIRMRDAHQGRILHALDTASAIVLLLTPRALYRPWIQAEIHAGQSLGATVLVARLVRCRIPEWVTPAYVVDRFAGVREADGELVSHLRRLEMRARARGRV